MAKSSFTDGHLSHSVEMAKSSFTDGHLSHSVEMIDVLRKDGCSLKRPS